ncbi:MAG: transcription repressor NadR [Lachnospiraceae bacterium]|nr:transcription repressor NadR [Lachnospiraceae bacterium]
MTGKERRDSIIKMISGKSPVSGGSLSKSLDVSRQIIVSDIALLRAEGYDIISTNRGYFLNSPSGATIIVKVNHTDEQTEDELNTIVDLGGTVIDVFVHHKVYGKISADLDIRSRRNVKEFIENIKSGKSTPLKNITSNYHYHTISAENEEILNIIVEELKNKGYLVEEGR